MEMETTQIENTYLRQVTRYDTGDNLGHTSAAILLDLKYEYLHKSMHNSRSKAFRRVLYPDTDYRF